MTTKNNYKAIRVYVGTYSQYNEGNLYGEWIDLTDLNRYEFYEMCKHYHGQEEDAEFMFQDTDIECEVLRNMVHESGIDANFWDLKEAVLELNDSEVEAFDAYVSAGYDADIDAFADAFFCYINEYNINEAFGEYYADMTGEISEIPKHLQYYFDYEAYGKDLLSDAFFEQDGYIFTRN